MFSAQNGYTRNWPFAWAVEYNIDERRFTSQFRKRAEDLSGLLWVDLVEDPEFNIAWLYQAAADVLPDHFAGGPVDVERAVSAATQSGVSPEMLVRRLQRWCVARDAGGRRQKIVVELDELGQWISQGDMNDRTMQVQAVVETAATLGEGRVWIVVTAHGEISELRNNVQQEMYAKILGRFGQQCKLSNDDISRVVEERILRKTQPARVALLERFNQRAGEITDMGTVQKSQRVYPVPDTERFALFYPYLPWTVSVIPDVVKGIAQTTDRDEALTGSNRTMIAVTQGGIIDPPGLLDAQVGRLLGLADLYDQFAADMPVETKTDMGRILETVPGATSHTVRVARAVYLLGQAKYIPTTVDNISRALIDSLDTNLGALTRQAELELEKLVGAGYVKRVGDQYIFLTTQQRTFQERVRGRQEELVNQTYELSQALSDYDSDDALRFDKVPVQGREITLRLELDGRVVRNRDEPVSARVYSPLQHVIEPQIANDAHLQQLSAQDPNNIYLRMANVGGLRATLALAVATEEVAQLTTGTSPLGGSEGEVARQVKQVDLPLLKEDVRRHLRDAMRGGTIFFRGGAFPLASGDGVGSSVRMTLAQLLPGIYPRLSELTHRIVNEEAAVKAALNNNTSNADLMTLGVFRADGAVNESHPLLSTLRGKLPLISQGQGPVSADVLRTELVRPPFGWDGHAVKVGLALLLRLSACKLIENSRSITDPLDADALALLTKEARFRTLRVQGVATAIDMATLKSVRESIERVFGLTTKTPLVPDTLNNVLGEQLNTLAREEKDLQVWANTAQCLLPLPFEAGSSLVDELLDNALPQVRLPRFLAEAEVLLRHTDLLGSLTAFRREQGATFLQVRDFFQGIVYAEIDLPEVRTFIADWKTVAQQERSVTDPARWGELVQAYTKAQQAITTQAHQWREQAQAHLNTLHEELATKVAGAGVPRADLDTKVYELQAMFDAVRARLASGTSSIHEAKGILTALNAAEVNMRLRLNELRTEYQAHGSSSTEVVLSWPEIVGEPRVTISSMEDFHRVIESAMSRIQEHLDRRETVVIEWQGEIRSS
jgi:hypothetical protein